MNLIWELLIWHSLAKLRLHTESTIKRLEETTINLGHQFRYFTFEICPHFETFETPREQQARNRRKAQEKPAGGRCTVTVNSTSRNSEEPDGANRGGRKKKIFNISTYKMHSLGHYVHNIRLFGTTDSYSTQIVRLFYKFIGER